jgi:hypothetical protein
LIGHCACTPPAVLRPSCELRKERLVN